MTQLTGNEDRLDRIEQKLDKLVSEFDKMNHDVDKLATDNAQFNDKFENYQKAIQWVVQLAFGLIASATITIIISSIFRR